MSISRVLQRGGAAGSSCPQLSRIRGTSGSWVSATRLEELTSEAHGKRHADGLKGMFS